MFKTLFFCLVLLCVAGAAQASNYLLYFEGQEVFGYSSALRRTIPYSMNPDAEMQKPSIGFDYLQRFSGESGDFATLALQYRFALTQIDNGYKTEGQFYNAYVKVKTPLSYIWVGHNRPAFGLGSYFDSHGLLLRTLAVQGFGYDRDWGGGVYRDFSWGDVAATVTTGTGMPIRENGNYMLASRASYGVLSQDNWNLGFSLAYGKTLDTMGYTVRDREPRWMKLAGMDMAILWNNQEHRFDVLGGKWLDQYAYALFYRFGLNLDAEGRFKIEAQPTYWMFGDEKNFQMSVCFSVLATSNLTLRTAYIFDHVTTDHRFLLQLYYYWPVEMLSSLFRGKHL
jgi:hypothetical protein